MYCINIQGQLGNQMFQYAAMRTIAERNGRRLVVLNRYNQLRDAFGIGRSKAVEIFKYHLLLRTRFLCRMPRYSPPRTRTTKGISTEMTELDIPENHLVTGWLQSERFFGDNRSEVIRWFTPKAIHEERFTRIVQAHDIDLDTACVVHMRFGDFYTSDLGMGHPVLGWVLPPAYFQNALNKVPAGSQVIVVSDMPDRARRWLENVVPLHYVSTGNPPAVDMMFLMRARRAILSNSTFAWWGGWLNQRPDRTIIAPEFFNGWWVREWIPPETAVSGWEWIKVKDDIMEPTLAIN